MYLILKIIKVAITFYCKMASQRHKVYKNWLEFVNSNFIFYCRCTFDQVLK